MRSLLEEQGREWYESRLEKSVHETMLSLIYHVKIVLFSKKKITRMSLKGFGGFCFGFFSEEMNMVDEELS